MAVCGKCGAPTLSPAAECPACGSRGIDDRWAPPKTAAADDIEIAPFGYSAAGRPRRISLLAKAAMFMAAIVPPLGLALGIAASVAARRYRNRPGNRAVAISSIFVAMEIGLIWAWILFAAFVGYAETTRDTRDRLDGYDDLFGHRDPVDPDPAPIRAESTAELQRLIERILETEP